MSSLLDMFFIFSFLNDPFMETKTKILYIGLIFGIPILIFAIFMMLRKKEGFIGTDMHHGYTLHDANKTGLKERTDSLIKISKGYLPGERPKEGGLLENFENIRFQYYDPRNYEISPDYHRTLQQFGVDPNPIESLETPEFMIPKTYRTNDKYENLVEVRDNEKEANELTNIEKTFRSVEKNKFYADLLRSKCRAGNRSEYKNCGCQGPRFGEF